MIAMEEDISRQFTDKQKLYLALHRQQVVMEENDQEDDPEYARIIGVMEELYEGFENQEWDDVVNAFMADDITD